jgi:cysteine-rich repeat protein
MANPVPLLKEGTPKPDVRKGIRKNRMYCYDGDVRCDFDGVKDNNTCTFHAQLCVNNSDPRFPKCNPTDNHVFEVKRPRFDRLKDAADGDNLDALELAASSPPPGLGLTVMRKKTVIYTGGPNLDANLCTAQIELVAPLKQSLTGSFRKASRTFRFRVTKLDGKRDVDSLRVECRPSTCGNSEIEDDHEQCDDGNRNNGDGCNQACQNESP